MAKRLSKTGFKNVYRRAGSQYLMVSAKDAFGKRMLVSSGETEPEKAAKYLETLKRKVDAQKSAGVTKDDGPLTVRRWGVKCMEDRKASDVKTADQELARLKLHVFECVLPDGKVFGDILLDGVRRRHVKQLVQRLKKKKSEETGRLLGPRTIHNIYGDVRTIYRAALDEELLDYTPCTLSVKPTELPEIEEVNVSRDDSYYTHDEAAKLISDPRIPLYRRVLYAICIFTGCRIGEAAARRWVDYETGVDPLGKLTHHNSYSVKHKAFHPTKTSRIKYAPVHSTLAAMLAEWKLSGWANDQGRAPTAEDLIVASPGRGKWRAMKGQVISTNSSLKRLKEDLALLGLRSDRTQHDFRRTFLTLGVVDGADERWLNFVVNGRATAKTREMTRLYLMQHWPAICDAVAKLKISPRKPGSITQLDVAAMLQGSTNHG